MVTLEHVERLLSRLREVDAANEDTALDAKWLSLRCADTIRYRGDMQVASLRELGHEVRTFIRDHPQALPASIAEDWNLQCPP
jgi:hypothetical protein